MSSANPLVGISSALKMLDEFEKTIRGGGRITDELRLQVLIWHLENDGEHCDLAVYDPPLLRLFLENDPIYFHGEDLRSGISRCIEHCLSESLDLLLSVETKGDRRLFLRWIGSAELYVKAREKGWSDVEWEKRLVLLQRTWRARKRRQVKPQSDFRYEGPELKTYEETNRYYGYRHCTYEVRWNRKYRYRLYSKLLAFSRWGDCAWEAFTNFLGENEITLPRPVPVPLSEEDLRNKSDEDKSELL